MKRPLFVIGLAFLAGSWIGVCFGLNVAVAIGAVCLLSGILFRLGRDRFYRILSMLLLASGIALCLVAVHIQTRVAPVLALDGITVEASAVVTDISYTDDKTSYTATLRLPLTDGSRRNIAVRLYSYTALDVELGNQIDGIFRLNTLGTIREYSAYQLAQGQLVSCYATGDIRIKARPDHPSLSWYMTRYREALISSNSRYMPYAEGDVLNAMTLGYRKWVSAETEETMKRSGVMHLLVVSGFHLSVFVTLVLGIFSRLGLSRRQASLAAIPCVLGFMALCGFTPSVVRSGIMTLLYLGAALLLRRYDSLGALGLSAIVICAINPYYAMHSGFLLSFGSTLGILLFGNKLRDAVTRRLYPHEKKPGRFGRALISNLTTTLAAYIISMPILMYSFGTVSLIAPVTGLVIMPLASVVIPLGFLFTALAAIPFLGFAAGLLGYLLKLLLAAALAYARLMESVPFAAVPVRYTYIFILLACFYLTALFLYFTHAKTVLKRYAAVFGVLVLTVSLLAGEIMNYNTVRIFTLEDCGSLLIIKGGSAAVVGLPEMNYDARQIASLMQENNVRSLDLVVVTDFTNDNALTFGAVTRLLVPKVVIAPEAGRYTDHVSYYTRDGTLYPIGEMTVTLMGDLVLTLTRGESNYVAAVSSDRVRMVCTTYSVDSATGEAAAYNADIVYYGNGVPQLMNERASAVIQQDRTASYCVTIR